MEIPNQISMNVYVSGCMKRCHNCHNPSLWQFNSSNILDENNLDNFFKKHNMAKWICFLGGDAIYQPKGLEKISELPKKLKKNVCLYTGVYFSQLSGVNISNIDLVIDGPYEEQKGTVDLPTTNQHCYVNENGIWRAILFENLKEYKWDTK